MLAYEQKHYRPGFSRWVLPEILRFGLPFAGANLLSFLLLNVDYIFVGRLLGATELGTYVLAFNIATLAAGLLNSMTLAVSVPAFSELKADQHRLRESTIKATRSVALVAFPVAGLTLALAQPLIVTVYGQKWEQAAPVLSVLSVYGAISIICFLFANVLSGLGRTRVLFVLQFAWLSALIPAMSIGVHQRGIVGAAIAHVVVIVALVFPAYLFVLIRVTGVRLTRLAAALLPSLAIAAAVTAVARLASAIPGGPLLQLIAGGVAGGLLYLALAGPSLASIVLNRQLNWRPARGAHQRAIRLAEPGAKPTWEARHATNPRGYRSVLAGAWPLGRRR
jgi:lipopolysaccharide exporter